MSKVVFTCELAATVAIERPDEALEAVRFHMGTLRQPLLALRFPNWIALARASIDLARHGIAHRSSGITETAHELLAAQIRGEGLHLFLDDPPAPVTIGGVTLQPTDHAASVEALRLARCSGHTGGALGSWAEQGGPVYRLAATVGHAVAIRRATASERAAGLGFVHAFLVTPIAVMTCGWPDDPHLDEELVEAEASLVAKFSPARGDA